MYSSGNKNRQRKSAGCKCHFAHFHFSHHTRIRSRRACQTVRLLTKPFVPPYTLVRVWRERQTDCGCGHASIAEKGDALWIPRFFLPWFSPSPFPPYHTEFH